jgi:hypothetical protein
MAKPEVKEYRLGSHPMFYAPGIIRWAQAGYRSSRGRARSKLVNIITEGWSGVPKEVAKNLLAGKYKTRVENETLVFVSAEEKKMSPSRTLFNKCKSNPRSPARRRYLEYLLYTLVPDLKESGRVHTAKDFVTLVKFAGVPGGRFGGFTKSGFINFLEGTLIPDLKDSGYDATAEDFETGVKVLKGKAIRWNPLTGKETRKLRKWARGQRSLAHRTTEIKTHPYRKGRTLGIGTGMEIAARRFSRRGGQERDRGVKLVRRNPMKRGDKVRVPHRGRMVTGKVVRYDKGSLYHGVPFYVVDVGEYESIKVPLHKAGTRKNPNRRGKQGVIRNPFVS